MAEGWDDGWYGPIPDDHEQGNRVSSGQEPSMSAIVNQSTSDSLRQ